MANVLVLTYWSYRDALIQTYTLPYVRRIRKYSGGTVYLVTMEQEQLRMSDEEKQRVQKELAAEGIVPVFLSYKPFGGRAAFSWAGYLLRLFFFILFKRISFIHAWCTPAGGIGYYLSKWTGRPLILDSFEPHAEAMVENGTWSKDSRAFRILFSLEKKQAHRAKSIIALSEGMKKYAAKKYGLQKADWHIKPALIDFAALPVVTETQQQQLRKELQLENKIVFIYAGKTGGIYLEDELFRLFRAAYDAWGEQLAVVMLTPDAPEKVTALATKNNVPAGLIRTRFVPQAEVFAYLSLAGFAVTPVKPVSSKRCCTVIKDSEYWSAGLPVIIPPGISDDSELIAATNTGVTWNDFSIEGCQQAVHAMKALLETTDRRELKTRCRKLAEMHRNMTLAENIYAKLYSQS